MALALLLPMGFSLHHALVQHEDRICHAEGEQHVHEYHLNCDHDHYFNTSEALEPEMDFALQVITHPLDAAVGNYEFEDDLKSFHFDGRGPPLSTASC